MRARAALAGLIGFLVAAAGPARAQDWQADWQHTIAAAKAEGALTISGPSGVAWREQLLLFEKDYPDIKLSITAGASRDFWPRIIKEREAGQKLWDFRIGGPDRVAYFIKRSGGMQPVRPLLVLPEVTDPAVWQGGLDGIFLDAEHKYFLGFVAYEENVAYYNSKIIAERDMPDMKALVDPRWQGKISIADPRAGSAMTGAAVLMRIYGEDYLRRLLGGQKLVVSKEARQQMDWMESGRYPIAIGIPSIAFVEIAARGAPVDMYRKLPGPRVWTEGVGGVQMLEGAPHPNAAKLYINWLLTRAVQTRLMKAVKLNSRRKDVPLGKPEDAIDYAQIGSYVGGQTEEQQPYQVKAAEIVKQLLP
jgi:ABC-type Fe3+ transport system substrate-binding protein